MNSQVDIFKQALLSLDTDEARAIVRRAQSSHSPQQLIETLIMPALEDLGQSWEDGDVALSQVYMSGRICEQLVNGLLPNDIAEHEPPSKIAIVTLEDYHQLGKRIVQTTLHSAGIHVLDYGRMSVEELVQSVRRDNVEILLISTLMLPSALRIKSVRARLGAVPKIIVGGAPFRLDSELWREVGADAMGALATDAVLLVRQMLEGAR